MAAIKSGASAASRSLNFVAQLELVLVGAVLLVLAGLLLARELRRWRGRHRPHSHEVRARAVMGELCPNGWQAQLTLYGSEPGEPGGAAGAHVALDWSELPGDGGEPPPTRRVWAATIADALTAMVDDRRTDEVLERIERSAALEDDPWDAL
ncbi:MAG: hypothetical protein ABSB73_01830 [Solirubrobacteraceae bacterium]